MKKKIFSIVLLFAFLVPCVLFMAACGEIKSLDKKMFVFAKVEVDGSISKEDYENNSKTQYFKFSEEEVIFYNGVEETTYSYKYEDSKIYIKDVDDEVFPEDAFAEMSGNYMVVSQSTTGGVVKVYFKVK